VFIVFFDFQSATVTSQGLGVLQTVAEAYKAGGVVTVQVTGYDDRAGTPEASQKISEQRANAVAQALVRLGVPANAMVVSGRGQNDNRVPTGPGVREPQNRRVEIVLQ
jgi:OmpA-OmpF porin, OOP family